jgi:hypothetical protein
MFHGRLYSCKFLLYTMTFFTLGVLTFSFVLKIINIKPKSNLAVPAVDFHAEPPHWIMGSLHTQGLVRLHA